MKPIYPHKIGIFTVLALAGLFVTLWWHPAFVIAMAFTVLVLGEVRSVMFTRLGWRLICERCWEATEPAYHPSKDDDAQGAS